jgi:hypothetical protein
MRSYAINLPGIDPEGVLYRKIGREKVVNCVGLLIN